MIRRGLLFSLGAVVTMLGLWLWAGLRVHPDAIVAVHWNVDGEVDRFVRATAVRGLLLFPAMGAATGRGAGRPAACGLLPDGRRT
jgi:hypothetical protein